MNSLVNTLKNKYNLNDEVVRILKLYDRIKFHPIKNKTIYYNRPKLIPNTKQTMSAPHIHAIALNIINSFVNEELKRIGGNYNNLKFNVLDVGCGTGYITAVTAEILKLKINRSKVIGIDINDKLVELTKKNLVENGFFHDLDKNKIIIKKINGWDGYYLESPYMFIHVGASASVLPINLYNQLAINGVLLIPINNDYMLIKKINYNGKIKMVKKKLFDVRFVKLVK